MIINGNMKVRIIKTLRENPTGITYNSLSRELDKKYNYKSRKGLSEYLNSLKDYGAIVWEKIEKQQGNKTITIKGKKSIIRLTDLSKKIENEIHSFRKSVELVLKKLHELKEENKKGVTDDRATEISREFGNWKSFVNQEFGNYTEQITWNIKPVLTELYIKELHKEYAKFLKEWFKLHVETVGL